MTQMTDHTEHLSRVTTRVERIPLRSIPARRIVPASGLITRYSRVGRQCLRFPSLRLPLATILGLAALCPHFAVECSQRYRRLIPWRVYGRQRSLVMAGVCANIRGSTLQTDPQHTVAGTRKAGSGNPRRAFSGAFLAPAVHAKDRRDRAGTRHPARKGATSLSPPRIPRTCPKISCAPLKAFSVPTQTDSL